MKTYKDLWEPFLSDDNILLAVKNVARGTKNNRIKQIAETIFKSNDEEKRDKEIKKIKRIAKNFHPPNHTPKEIYDGVTRKKRTIIVPKPYEQVVHHMMINILKPIYLKGAYEHCYTIGDRTVGRNSGVHHGKKYVERYIREYNGADIKYCMKMDIKKFFENVPHDKLKERHARIIKDKKFLDLIYKVIDTVPDEFGQPLGFYPSQWTTDWYLQPLDHYIKEDLGAKFYARFRDDMVIFGSNKKEMHKMLHKIMDYLKDMGLELNHKYQIFRFEKNGKYRYLDFMGFKFYRNRTTLRKSILKRARRSAKIIASKDKPTIHDCKRFMSYMGWMTHTDTYGYFAKYIGNIVDVRECRYRVSKYDRRLAKLHAIPKIQKIEMKIDAENRKKELNEQFYYEDMEYIRSLEIDDDDDD